MQRAQSSTGIRKMKRFGEQKKRRKRGEKEEKMGGRSLLNTINSFPFNHIQSLVNSGWDYLIKDFLMQATVFFG